MTRLVIEDVGSLNGKVRVSFETLNKEFRCPGYWMRTMSALVHPAVLTTLFLCPIMIAGRALGGPFARRPRRESWQWHLRDEP